MNHLEPDVSGTVFDDPAPELTRVYADALLGAAETAGQPDELLGELEELISDVWDGQPGFESLMTSAAVDGAEKARILNEAFSASASSTVLNFLLVLNRHGRLGLLRQVARQARASWNQRGGRIPVVVRSAVALDEAQQAALRDRLTSLLNAHPILQLEVDPALIGGLVIQVGDHIYDASVRSMYVERMRNRLVEERTHELLSMSHTFSTP
jgi:F-type H+-transporting ATPase subunit delta